MAEVWMWWLLAACAGSDVGLTGHSSTGEDCVGAEPYVAGMSATTSGSGATVKLLSADPTPPDVGENTWSIEVRDAADEAVVGLAPVVTPWMPLHGHGLAPPDYVGADQGDGTYAVEVFDLIMPGLWEFTVDLAPTTAVGDAVVFRFCAEG